MFRHILQVAGLLLLLAGCSVNSNLMLKTGKNFVFDSIPQQPVTEYRLSANDLISFKLFANDGFKLVDISSGTGRENNEQNNNRNTVSYLIEADGSARLPIIGKIALHGLTVREAEFLLEEKYSTYYVSPFVQIEVTNKRVVVFPGNGSDAKVILLSNNNTTLLEALALAGGITERGKAKKVKIIRKQPDNTRAVYQVDLSTIEGLKYCDMIVQANDYIYVEPSRDVGRGVVAEIAPILSVLTSVLLIYTFVIR